MALWIMSRRTPKLKGPRCLHVQGWFIPSSQVQISLSGGYITRNLKRAHSSPFIVIFYFSSSKQHYIPGKDCSASLFHFLSIKKLSVALKRAVLLYICPNGFHPRLFLTLSHESHGYLQQAYINETFPEPTFKPWSWRQHVPPKHSYLPTLLHDVITWKKVLVYQTIASIDKTRVGIFLCKRHP